MTGEKHKFQILTLKEEGNVEFGGNRRGKIIGMGIIGNSSSPSIGNIWGAFFFHVLSYVRIMDMLRMWQ